METFLYTMVGSAFMLGIVATVILASRDVGHIAFDLVEIAEQASFAYGTSFVSPSRSRFHDRGAAVPPAHVAARRPHPHPGVILAGVMLKLGRASGVPLPEAAHWAKPLMLTLAVVGITYGAITATMQKDLKPLVRLFVGGPPGLPWPRPVRAHAGSRSAVG